MPEIARPTTNQNLRVCMYPDHVPAHFHVYDRGTGLAAWVPLSTLIPDPKRSKNPKAVESRPQTNSRLGSRQQTDASREMERPPCRS